ncbi:MAG TPA: ABC transporter substrate-binding protein [Steroidobacteraceae bacterium]|jgi:putative ABC transport system substrate-binding protein|nr:ABC transporter substrate-binding protein [Steroidobacteraceae bacterium]
MRSRRYFLASAATLILAPSLAAQSARAWRIGYLAPGNQDDPPFLQAFLDELRVLGYVQGQNIILEHRTAEGRFEALPALAGELAKLNVDIIVAPTTPVARAVKAATSSIPIVFTIVSDPIGSGLVTTFSHPGGNITGMTDLGVDLVGKQLDLLKQLVPRLKHVGVVGNPTDTVWGGVWREAPAAAHRLRLEVIPVMATTPSELEAAFADLSRRVEALLVAPQAFFSLHRRKIVELASSAQLPAIHELRAFPDAGALMSYGPNYPALFRKAAHHVDKILKGARPADLPVEQPTEYELVINLRTAKALGLTIPQPVLVRANDVIR